MNAIANCLEIKAPGMAHYHMFDDCGCIKEIYKEDHLLKDLPMHLILPQLVIKNENGGIIISMAR